MDIIDIMKLSEQLTMEYYEEVYKELKTYTDAVIDLKSKFDRETNMDKKLELTKQIQRLLKEQQEFRDLAMNNDKFLMTFIMNKMGLA